MHGSDPSRPDAARVRVAHLGPDPRGRGGMPAVLRALFESPLSRRYELDMIVTYATPSPLRRGLVFLAGLGRLVGWCLGPGPRVVHVHTTVRGSLYRKGVCVAIAKALGRPVILHVHSGVGDIAAFDGRLGPLRRRLFARAFAAADRVLSVSAAGAGEVERRFGRTGIEVVPNPAPVIEPVEQRDPPAGDGVEALYLGGFANAVKGGSVLLEALPAMVASPGPAPHVVIAGPGEPPAGAHGILNGGGARWAGWLDVDEKARALARAQIFLLPSTSEGLPVALLEAMAHGRAIVASRAGGIPEVMTDGVDGVLVPPGDAPRLAEAVRELVADPERRAALGGAARARAERLNEEEVSGRLDSLYRELSS